MKSFIVLLLLLGLTAHGAEIHIGLRDANKSADLNVRANWLGTGIALLLDAARDLDPTIPRPAHFAVATFGTGPATAIRLVAKGKDKAQSQRYLEKVVAAFFANRQREQQSHEALVNALILKAREGAAAETSDPLQRASTQQNLREQGTRPLPQGDPDYVILPAAAPTSTAK